MPKLFRVDFTRIKPSHVRASGVHHLLSQLLRETAEEHNDQKPYAVGPRIDHADGVTIHIRTLTERSAGCIVGIPANLPVLFGTHPAVVSTTPTLLADASWEDLATYHGTNRWRIEFLTPVSVRANQTDQPWPEPYTILNNLERKWQRWGPIPHKGFEEAVTKRLSVVWADLKTQISELPPHRTTAVTGCVEWLAPYRSDDAQVVERLLRFAEYAGFGGRTEHGLGTVRVSGGIDPSHPRRSKKPEG